MKIRLAKTGDIENFVKCHIEIWESLREWLPASFVDPGLESLSKPEGAESLRRGIESKETIYLVAEDNGEFIGLITGREQAGVANLGFFGVKKENRRKKTGSALLSKFVEIAEARKAHKIWLYTSPFLVPAIHLYIKNEFVPEGFLRNHTYGLDLIIYSKFI